MRKALLLAVAAALVATPAASQTRAGQRTAPAASPPIEAQRAQVQQALTRGRALAVLDQAGRVTTRDMLAKVPNPNQAGIDGWIAQPEGNGVTVTYYAQDGDNFSAIYRAQVIGGRVSSPQVYPANARPALTGAAARMAAARAAAQTLDNKPCGGPAFNLLVLPPEGEGAVSVYQMTPRTAADRVPAGGHFRTDIAADGSIASSTPLAASCSDLVPPAAQAGQRPRPLVVDAPEAIRPNELHVFLSLWTRRPLVVRTGTDASRRLWGVTADGIAELQKE